MINFFEESFVNDINIGDNLFLFNPSEDISNNFDINEDIYPNFFLYHCHYCDRINDTNSNVVINEQENNHINNNQINSINNNNSNSNNNMVNSNNNNTNSNSINNTNSNNNNVNERIPNSNPFNYSDPTLNFRFKPRKKEIIKNIKELLTKTKFIKSLNKDKDCCIICLQEFKNNQNIYKLSCSHIFHIRCLNKEIKYRKKCPMCRKKF